MNNLNYGIIGNCKSAALISRTGSIDWCCLPDFDSSSIFAHLLDAKNGGTFFIEPEGTYTIRQQYIDKTNILQTTFSGEQHAFELVDFMPRYKTDDGIYHCPPDIIRYLKVTKGNPRVRICYNPRPVYAQYPVKYETATRKQKRLRVSHARLSVLNR